MPMSLVVFLHWAHPVSGDLTVWDPVVITRMHFRTREVSVYVGRVWVVPTRLKIRPPNCRAPVAPINNQSVLPAILVYPIPLSGEMPDCRLGDLMSPEPYDL